jgi:hypothetical protein
MIPWVSIHFIKGGVGVGELTRSVGIGSSWFSIVESMLLSYVISQEI